MRKLFLLCVCVAIPVLSGCSKAWAEPKALGTIRVSDAGSTNNAETGYLDGLSLGWGAFALNACTHYSVQAATGLNVNTDCRNTDAGYGTRLATDQFFTIMTACGSSGQLTISPKVDGGVYRGGLICIAPLAGSSSAVLTVFPSTGNE